MSVMAAGVERGEPVVQPVTGNFTENGGDDGGEVEVACFRFLAKLPLISLKYQVYRLWLRREEERTDL